MKPNEETLPGFICEECGLPVSICNVIMPAARYYSNNDNKKSKELYEEYKSEISRDIQILIAQGLTKGREEREICICAAVKTTKGYVVRGHRHANCIKAIREMGLAPSKSPDAQGFITSKNRYVNREQGRKLQEKAGIKSADKGGYMGNTLFSEDLYRDFEELTNTQEDKDAV